MLLHYLKVAVRNLLKYKTQSVISILGLAVGFACFSLSVIWIKYELTYDSFHEHADKICKVRIEDEKGPNGFSSVNPYVLADYLKETFPEVEGACSMQGPYTSKSKYFSEERRVELQTLSIDSAAFSVFDIQVLEGTHEFLLPYRHGQPHKVAITRRGAQELYGDENPIGKVLYGEFNKHVPMTICAVVSEWSNHSNLKYDLLNYCFKNDSWWSGGWSTFIRLHKDVDFKSFAKKLYEHSIDIGHDNELSRLVPTPITSLRYERPDIVGEVKFNHVILFSIAGTLVVLCCLLNYVNLFINRIRTRSKEFALRLVNGSSSWGLFKLLMCEFIILLLVAWLVGMLMVEILIRPFKALSEVTLEQFDIYGEASVCCLFMIILSIMFATFPILYFRNKSVHSILSVQANGRSKDLYRKVSILFQLIISIGFIFCASVIMKQLYYLNHSDAGMQRRNIVSIQTFGKMDDQWIADQIQQFPDVEEVLPQGFSLLPENGKLYLGINDWENKAKDAALVNLQIIAEDSTFARFYGLTILKGRMIDDSSEKTDLVLNETAVKTFGWHVDEAVGKHISMLYKDTVVFRIVGVMKDYYVQPPSMPVAPIGFGNPNFELTVTGPHNILLRIKDGTWNTCRQKIEALIKERYPNEPFRIYDTEEEYSKFLTSENALLKMLTVLSIVCIIISVFGIYSQVVLTCEQRRKEIAIRKVNGAMLGDILSMFAKEYMMLLIMASVIAFAVGYAIMKHWLENYTRHTEISLWLFASIFAGIALIIAFSIGYRVYKAANENPADVVKSE